MDFLLPHTHPDNSFLCDRLDDKRPHAHTMEQDEHLTHITALVVEVLLGKDQRLNEPMEKKVTSFGETDTLLNLTIMKRCTFLTLIEEKAREGNKMNREKAEAFAERIIHDVNSAFSSLNLYIGYRLGLFDALTESGPITVEKLARNTKYAERYLLEWLSSMAAGNYIDYDPKSKQFSLSPEHSMCLANQDSAAYTLPFVAWIPSVARVLPGLMNSFRNGGGVPYDEYGDDARVDGIGVANRPLFVNEYVSKWIPTMPDIEERLMNGARVADIGCGIGWSSIILARGFPNIQIDALDGDKASIIEARRIARENGVEDRVTFHASMMEESNLQGPYALVTAFEVVHDMPYPVKGLSRMHEIVADDGAVLLAEEAVGDTLEENQNFLGHLMYNFSTLHCLPQSMAFADSAGIGTVMGPSKVRRYAEDAGFSKVDILPIENPLWRFYRLTP